MSWIKDEDLQENQIILQMFIKSPGQHTMW